MIGKLPKSERDIIALYCFNVRMNKNERKKLDKLPTPIPHSLPVHGGVCCRGGERGGDEAVGAGWVGDSVSGIYNNLGKLRCEGN